LVIDEHNSARSQTAAALFRSYAPGHFTAESAGVSPSPTDDPIVAGNLRLRGVELNDAPKPISNEMLMTDDHIIFIGEVPLALVDEAAADVTTSKIPQMEGISDQQLSQVIEQIEDKAR
jgi:protein-tyrosine-phosphatase